LIPRRRIPTEYFVLALAWLFWGTSQSLLRIENSKKDDSWQIVSIVLVQAANFFLANLFTIYSIDWIRLKVKGMWCQYSSYLLCIILTALLVVFINVSFYNYANGKSEIIKSFSSYLINGSEKIIFIAGFSTMFFLIRNLKEYQKQQSILEEAQQTARDAQLQMLQQQLNPHFLFNTLNSLRSLIAIDTDRARGMVTDLSEFLRVTLSSYKSVQNTIHDEVKLLAYYLKIQKIRFENELYYTIEIQKDIENFTIPKFIFQPLVENAAKYGMLTSQMPLQIKIEAYKTEAGVAIHITNSGSLVASSTEKHANNGISNTKTRLELMFPGKSSFVLREDSGLVRAEIFIQTPINV
jgi:two-component system, LytTR family, sensor kinase